MLKRALLLISFILLPLIIGGISGYFTVSAISSWYSTLVKPSFNPPNWIFGPVWTTLYILMGYSSYRIYQSPKSDIRNQALTIYGLQLIFNFFWSILFFKFHLLGVALIEISILLVLLIMMFIRFKQIDRTAAFLNIPYLIWVSFATILNASIWYLNA
jgi:tryptophan-rich sensory protein